MASEFSLIEHYFQRDSRRADVALGVGDDAALLRPPEGQLLAAAVDTLLIGVHFPDGTRPADLGWKALAVNLSDLAAMGAEPAWATLSLSMPAASERWLKEFAEGFFELADSVGIELVGGDTVKGPLAVTVQVHGFVPEDKALTRADARPGDAVYVSGTLGDAAWGLKQALAQEIPRNADEYFLRERLDRPSPRIELGMKLRGIASSAIDLSDGLAADLGHIMERSNLGAAIETASLPLSEQLRGVCSEEEGRSLGLNGGDDYELCFTVPQPQQAVFEAIADNLGVTVTRIGEMNNEVGGLRVDGVVYAPQGYDHFRSEAQPQASSEEEAFELGPFGGML